MKNLLLIIFTLIISFNNIYSKNTSTSDETSSKLNYACSAKCKGGDCDTDGPGRCGCSSSGSPVCGYSMDHVEDIPIDLSLFVSASSEQIEFQNRFVEMLNTNNNSEAWNFYKSAVLIEYEMIKNGNLLSNSLIAEINAFNNLSDSEKKLIVDFK